MNTQSTLNISLCLNFLNFLKYQASHSKNGLQPQLIRYDANCDTD